jgi:cytochrome b subunit of formate dehydrogenase
MKALLDNLKKIIHWTLLVIIVIYIISGIGIVYSGIIEPVTLGILTKNLAYEIHIHLLIPFLIILIAHIILNLKKK